MNEETKRRIWWTAYEGSLFHHRVPDGAEVAGLISVINAQATVEGRRHKTYRDVYESDELMALARDMAKTMLAACPPTIMRGGVDFTSDRRYC